MIAYLNDLLHNVLFYRHMIPVLWRHFSGRLYVYRNVPTWVVREVVDNPPPEDRADDPDVAQLYEQACDELRLRDRRAEVAA